MKVKIGGNEQDVKAVWMEGKVIKFIDQPKLPGEFQIIEARSLEDVARFIRDMVVRGAPAIGVAAAFGMAQARLNDIDLGEAAQVLKATRPTAQDLFYAVDRVKGEIEGGRDPVEAASSYSAEIEEQCRLIGEYGATLIKDGARVLTHCNAGALATVDWGTALAPMRVAHRLGRRFFVYVDETRPRLQGARLTAWELVQEGIDHAIIADNAAGHYISRGEVDLVIVGADRIVANGDFANKIGTYEKAVVARESMVPFFVAAPSSTFDRSLPSGDKIPIEERAEEEVLEVGGKRLSPIGSRARNPAFDVTPARFVTAFVTEKGIIKPGEL